MNTPSPLVPQGSLPSAKNKTTIRIVVLTILAFHAVFLGGLLMQGCKPDATQHGASNTDPPRLGGMDSARTDTNTFYPALPDYLSAPTNTTVASMDSRAVGIAPTPLKLTPGPSDLLPPDATPTETKEYAIVAGDTLAEIAKAHHTTVGALMKVNPALEPRKLKVGQKIQIPAAPATVASGIGFAEPKAAAGVGTGETTYVIKSGDTLTKIARQHNVTIKALKTANELKTDQIMVGKKLKIPPGAGTASASGASTGGGGLSLTNPAGVPTVR